jgi:cellulose biosynthesis protein BcsQ
VKKLKILVLSSKGGVGKSTLAMQIITPYLYEKNAKEKINFFEFDDENIDILSYGASQLTNRESIDVEEFVIMDKFIEILSKEQFCCIDVGGNKSTTLCLDTLNDCGMIEEIDLVIIPLLDGEQDAVNAKKVYDQLQSINPNINIAFALNRAKNAKFVEYQFDNFFGDIRGVFDDKNAVLHNIHDKYKENYIIIEDNDIIKYSRKFGMTIYEIAVQKRDFISEFKELKEEKEKKILSFKNYVYQNGKKYYETTLQTCFQKLDSIIEKENYDN